MKKSMLGCRFSCGAYAKNATEKATKCSFKTTDAGGHVFILV